MSRGAREASLRICVLVLDSGSWWIVYSCPLSSNRSKKLYIEALVALLRRQSKDLVHRDHFRVDLPVCVCMSVCRTLTVFSRTLILLLFSFAFDIHFLFLQRRSVSPSFAISNLYYFFSLSVKSYINLALYVKSLKTNTYEKKGK